MRSILIALALLALLAAAPASSVRVPQAQIDAENARWTALGIKLPPGGIVLPEPYAQPYSNRSFVVPYSWYERFSVALRQKNDVPVDASALRADLPVLHFLLEKAYAGYQPAEERGWNWDRMFRDWSAQLARSDGKSLPLKQAFAPWARLEDVQVDNHSGVAGFAAFNSESTSAQLASNPNGSCSALRFAGGRTSQLSARDPGQQPHAVQAWDGTHLAPAWYVSYPKRLGDATAIRCGARDVALTAVAKTAPLAQTPVYRTLAGGIAYLRLPAFTDTNIEALRTALSRATELGKERLVIFDLRGNDGGNAPSDILTNWFAESAVEQADSVSQTATTSCFTVALFFGLQQQLITGLKAPVSAGLQQALQQMVDQLKGSATPGCSVQPSVRRADRSMRDHRFDVHPPADGQTRVVALVDNGCGSDCEYMVYLLGGLPNTVIAGSSTYGVMGFTQPGYFVLPHSRVPFRFALSRTDAYGDGRSVDGYGMTVDVLLATAQSQSEASLAALAKILAT